MYKFTIVHNRSDLIVFVTNAADEQEALDDYAAYRSGYCTLSRMAQSATFREMADVHAEASSI